MKIEIIAGKLYRLCCAEGPDGDRCDRCEGHAGKHTWQIGQIGRPQHVNLQEVADAIRDAGRSAMEKRIREWCIASVQEFHPIVPADEVNRWFDAKVAKLQDHEFFTTELIHQFTVGPVRQRCNHGFHNSSATCQLDLGHGGPHSSIRY